MYFFFLFCFWWTVLYTIRGARSLVWVWLRISLSSPFSLWLTVAFTLRAAAGNSSKNLQLPDLRLCRQKSLPTHWPISSQSHSYIATCLAYQCSTPRVNFSLAYCTSHSFAPSSSHPSPVIGVWEFPPTVFLNLGWISLNFKGLLKLLGMGGGGFRLWELDLLAVHATSNYWGDVGGQKVKG